MIQSDRPEVRVLLEPDFVARAAADTFEKLAKSKAAEGRIFTVALSGGSTPVRLFKLLAAEPYRSQVPWRSIHFFWGDERNVPPDDPESNFGVANSTLLSLVNVPEDNIHRIKGELDDPVEAAAGYEIELLRFFGLAEGEIPRFDLVLLGMGPDGHTASLFPGTQALSETNRLVVAPWIDKLQTHRITLTLPVFNKAACIQFLVTGTDKAATLKAVFQGDPAKPHYPAQLIRPESGDLTWLVDEAAAGLL